MRNTFAAIKLALLLSLGSLPAFSIVPLYATDLVEPLGDLKTLSGWSGLEPGATLKVPGAAAFVYPNGPRGQFKHGFRVLNDSAAEWQNFYGVQFEVNLPDTREVELTATIERAARGSSPETPVSGSVRVSGAGWRTVTLPWSAFEFDQAAFAFLKYVKEFKIAARFADGKSGGKIQLRNVRVVKAPTVALECDVRGKDADNAGTRTVGSEDGVLKLDVHTLWPLRQEIMVATAPEPHDTEKRLFYTVRGDGKTLAEGKFGAWILGMGDIDVPLDGVKQLELETRVEISRKPTVFWAGARIVTKDGKEIPLSELPLKFENIEQPKNAGQDYFGGPIKILGNEYKTAAPGQPKNDKQPGLVRVDLSGVNAVRFKATLGSDYPLGNEAQRRKVYAIRAANGDEARFLTVIEPYEDKALVKSAVAVNADKLRVELTDGRVQEITLKNFDGSGKDIEAHIVETKDGQVLRQESTVAREAAAR